MPIIQCELTLDGTKVLLVGHPNVGKSVLFNRLSGSKVTVSNYPGTTVDLHASLASIGSRWRELVDTPGTRSLVSGSDDERVTESCLLENPGATVVQVGDSKNLRRTLFLTSQLMELEFPMVLVLNMMDECREGKEVPDPARLSRKIGCPVVATTAVTAEGVAELGEKIPSAIEGSLRVEYPLVVERAIDEIHPYLEGLEGRRGLAVLFLCGDPVAEGRLSVQVGKEGASRLRGIRAEAARQMEIPLPLAIHQARYDQMSHLAAQVLRKESSPGTIRSRAARGFYAAVALPLLGFAAGWVATYVIHFLCLKFLLGRGLWAVHAGGAFGALLFTWRGVQHRRRGLSTKESLGELSIFPSTALPLLALSLYAPYLIVGVFAAGDCVNFIEKKLFGNVRGYLETGAGLRETGFDVGLYLPLSNHFTAGEEYLGWTFFHVPWKGLNYYLAAGTADLLGGRDHPLYELFFHEEMGLIRVGLTYSIAIVLPIVAFFFLLFGILEDSGYLPRIAVLTDRTLKRIGLNGKAILPLILGLGCDTMATMTTRILETKKERTIAILLLALAVPCSAQLGIISGVMARVSPLSLAIFAVFIAGQLLVVGFISSKLVRGRISDFLIEIPPIRAPLLANVWMKTFTRVKWFLVEAVPLFLMGTFILFVASKLGVIPFLTGLGEPVVTGVLGLPADTTMGFLLGFLRRDFAAVRILDGFVNGGTIDTRQVLVAVVVITLFVPCLANFFVMVREKGLRTASLMAAFIFPYAVLVGGALRWILGFVPAVWLGGS